MSLLYSLYCIVCRADAVYSVCSFSVFLGHCSCNVVMSKCWKPWESGVYYTYLHMYVCTMYISVMYVCISDRHTLGIPLYFIYVCMYRYVGSIILY